MHKIILFVSLVMALVISGCGNPTEGGTSSSGSDATTTMKKKGESCTVNEQCEGALKCLTDTAGKEMGVCKEVTLCVGKNLCVSSDDACTEATGLNDAIYKICLPKNEVTNPIGGQKEKVKDGEECRVDDVCEGDLKCLAKQGQTDVGVCRAVTLCDANKRCRDENVQHCVSKDGLNGAKFFVCEPKPTTNKKQEGEICDAIDACDTNLECLAVRGSTTQGICQSVTLCTRYGTCNSRGMTCNWEQGIGVKVGVCRLSSFKKEGQECISSDTCETGTVCRAKEGSTVYGICERVKKCTLTGDQCDPTSEACKEIKVIGSTDQTYACLDKHFCTDTAECNKDGKTGEVCLASALDQSRGTCVKGCMADPLVCDNGETCQDGGPMLLDKTSLPERNVRVCKPSALQDKLSLNDWCKTDDQCADEGALCIRGVCTVPCYTVGFETECLNQTKDLNDSPNWCLPFDTKNPDLLTCGPRGYSNIINSKMKSVEEGQPCGMLDGIFGICDHSSGCILENEGDRQGTCKDTYGLKSCDPSVTPSCNTGETCQPLIVYGGKSGHYCLPQP